MTPIPKRAVAPSAPAPTQPPSSVTQLPNAAIDLANRMFDLARRGDLTLLDYLSAVYLPTSATIGWHGGIPDPNQLNGRGQSIVAGAVFKGFDEVQVVEMPKTQEQQQQPLTVKLHRFDAER
ncbi:uncharacterized protein UTRI_02410 [Ustilago trichophora]|uniref:Uncharacterized protein n=1 Tax=Ustilago trichophora TaxID=86804 RepID=A0A5C3E5Z0_9BASI|nr:uncharacterized protein UTRI_02410 [Ustilago trichophora]